MSSEYMRQILESIEQAQQLDEGYDERVAQVANIIKRDYPDGITKNEFGRAVEKAGQEAGAVEMRGSAIAGRGQKIGDSRKEFINDVAAQIDFRRDTSKTDAKRARTEQVLNKLADVISDAVGMSFPDGDPFDHIFPQARKMGIPADNVLAWLDRAVRKSGMGKSYHSYLQDLWQDQYNDARSDYERMPNSASARSRYDMLGGDRFQNPWGS